MKRMFICTLNCTALLVCLFGWSACIDDGSDPSDGGTELDGGDSDVSQDSSVDGGDADTEPPVVDFLLAPESLHLSDDHVSDLAVTNFEIITPRHLAEELDFEVGTILISSNPQNPFLRRITAIEESGDSLRLSTEHAALTDAFEELHLEAVYAPDDGAKASAGLRLSLSQSFGVRGEIGALSADGEVRFELSGGVTIRIDISAFTLERFEAIYVARAGIDAELSLSATERLELLDRDIIEIPEIRLAPPTPIGPIVVTPILSSEVELDVAAEAGIGVTFEQTLMELTGEAGLVYDGSEWSTVDGMGFEVLPDFDGLTNLELSLRGGVSAELGFPIKIELRIFELAGPTLSVVPFTEMSMVATTEEGCLAFETALSTGAALELGATFNPLGLCEIDVDFRLGEVSRTLAEELLIDRAHCSSCALNYCEDRGLTSGDHCDGTDLVTCTVVDECSIETARTTCAELCESGECTSCPSNFCQSGGHSTGSYCDGDDRVTCSTDGPCNVVSARSTCPDYCDSGACSTCDTNFCSTHGYMSGSFCDGDTRVTCGYDGHCAIVLSVAPCSSGCESGTCCLSGSADSSEPNNTSSAATLMGGGLNCDSSWINDGPFTLYPSTSDVDWYRWQFDGSRECDLDFSVDAENLTGTRAAGIALTFIARCYSGNISYGGISPRLDYICATSGSELRCDPLAAVAELDVINLTCQDQTMWDAMEIWVGLSNDSYVQSCPTTSSEAGSYNLYSSW